MNNTLDDLKPFCAMCNKDVEKMETVQNFCTMETVFVALCHGDKEIVNIPKHEFHEGLKLGKGIAFNNKRLNEPQTYIANSANK